MYIIAWPGHECLVDAGLGSVDSRLICVSLMGLHRRTASRRAGAAFMK